MNKVKMILIFLFLSMSFLIYYEVTHVFGTAKAQSLSLPEKSKDINAGIDKIDIKKIKSKFVIDVQGWAYINKLDAAQQISYIVLTSKNKEYVFKTEKVLRGDLPDALKDYESNVENSGMKTLINMDELVNGTYQIGYYIVNGTKAALSFSGESVTNDGFNVTIKEDTNNQVDMKFSELTNEVKANIEEVSKGNGILKIKGWAYLEDVLPEDSTIYLVLQDVSNKGNVIFDTQNQIRKDVTAYYEMSLDESGFITKIPSDIFKGKKYKIGIYVNSAKASGLYWSKESIGE